MSFLAAYGPFWTFAFLALFCFVAIKALKAWRGRADRYESDPDEVKLMQEFNRSLLRMEDRIEALETILMDRTARKKTAGREWE